MTFDLSAQKLLEDVVEAMNHEPPWDYGRARAAIRVAIEAAANVIEGWDTYDVWRSDGASAIRALLPPRSGKRHSARRSDDNDTNI